MGISDPNLPEILQDLRKSINQSSPYHLWISQAGYIQDLDIPVPIGSSFPLPSSACPHVRGAKGMPPPSPCTIACRLTQVCIQENSHEDLGSIVCNGTTSISLLMHLPLHNMAEIASPLNPLYCFCRIIPRPVFFLKVLVGKKHALKFLLGRCSINHPAGCLSSLHRWDFERDSSSINESSRLLAESYKTADCNSMLWKEYISLSLCTLKVLSEIIKGQKDRVQPKLKKKKSPITNHVILQLLCWNLFISAHKNSSAWTCQTTLFWQWNNI